VNLSAEQPDIGVVSPTDGKITLVTRIARLSLFGKKQDIGKVHVANMRVYAPKQVTLQADGTKITAQEFSFKTLPGRLRVITGRERKFVV
jgi:diacylglycerol kinase family enzyme